MNYYISFINKICFIALVSKCLICTETYELQYVQILYRHGDRAPIKLYPTDPNPESFWEEGLGKLSQLGKRQHYNFGKLLRQMYSSFITSDPSEIDVISSDVDRCIKSAEANTASFFAPDNKWAFEGGVNWQPISIHYIPQNVDKYLETDSDCPATVEEEKRIAESPEGRKFISENADMFRYLSHWSGLSITNWTSASYLHDTLFIEKKYGLVSPSWVETYWNQLSNVSDLSFYWSFNSPLMLRLRAGPLLGLIINKMNEKISGALPKLKVQVYSSHDVNVAVVLHALDIFNMKQPPYCATVVFELYKNNDEHAVRLLYFNSSTPETGDQKPNILILKGCTEYCPLDFFVQFTKNLIPADWEKECKLKTTFYQYSEIGIVLASVVTGVTLITILAVYFIIYKACCERRQKEDYAYHLMDSY